jgi:ppGpp synthetase/RelA/SpoT-type nucleotidyltranferase
LALTKAALRGGFNRRRAQYERANEQLKVILNALLDDLSLRYGMREGLVVMGEPKSFDSFYRKAKQKYKCQNVEEAFAKVRDLARARVICHTLDDCFRLVDLLSRQDVVLVDPTTIEYQIEDPSDTGYRAIHLEVLVDVPVRGKAVATPCELQIRTTLQEAWGHYTHSDFYKAEEVPPLVRSLMRELSDLLYYTDKQAALLIAEIARLRTGEGQEEDGEAVEAA